MELKTLKSIGALCKEQLPSILTGTAIIGVLATGVCAAKASPRAKEELEKLDNPTHMDKLKVITPIFLPTIMVGSGTIACIVGAHYENVKRYAALAGSYAIVKDQLRDHKNEVTELFGAKNTETIEHKIAKEQVEKKTDANRLICASDELVTCKDGVIGKVFNSSMIRIQNAANKVNTLVLLEGSARLGTFYEFLDEDYPEIAERIEWNISSHNHPTMEIEFDADISESGRPYIVFTYDWD